uniref:DUF834 domain-containing protein n=1 Tax=Oryza glumipatula TaxID=40148 RepID=A0A0E0B925_9ORYZ
MRLCYTTRTEQEKTKIIRKNHRWPPHRCLDDAHDDQEEDDERTTKPCLAARRRRARPPPPVGEEAALAVADGDGAALNEDVGEVGVLDERAAAVVEGEAVVAALGVARDPGDDVGTGSALVLRQLMVAPRKSSATASWSSTARAMRSAPTARS